jgi:hypothetical protein
MSDPKTIRCPACASEFTDAQVEGIRACPTCGNPGNPHAITEDVSLKINWAELRILGIWASWHADTFKDDEHGRHSKRTLKAILARLEAQFPGKPALSFAGEIQQLADHVGGKVDVLSSGKTETFTGRKPS